MSLESAKKFVQDVTENKELAAKFSKEMKGEWEDKLIADAKAEGYDFTAEELRDAILENQEIDVSELENVAGGYECRALGSGNECQAFAAGECKAFGSGDQCKAIAAGDQCKAFAAGDCTCFGSNKNEGCTFFGDNCKFLAT